MARYKIRSQYNPDGRPSAAFIRSTAIGTATAAAPGAGITGYGAGTGKTMEQIVAELNAKNNPAPTAGGAAAKPAAAPAETGLLGAVLKAGGTVVGGTADGRGVVVDIKGVKITFDKATGAIIAAPPAAAVAPAATDLGVPPGGPRDSFGRTAAERAKVVNDLYKWYLGREASPEERAGYQGMSNGAILRAVQTSTEAANYISAGKTPGAPIQAAGPGTTGAASGGGNTGTGGGASAGPGSSSVAIGSPGAAAIEDNSGDPRGFSPWPGPGIVGNVPGAPPTDNDPVLPSVVPQVAGGGTTINDTPPLDVGINTDPIVPSIITANPGIGGQVAPPKEQMSAPPQTPTDVAAPIDGSPESTVGVATPDTTISPVLDTPPSSTGIATPTAAPIEGTPEASTIPPPPEPVAGYMPYWNGSQWVLVADSSPAASTGTAAPVEGTPEATVAATEPAPVYPVVNDSPPPDAGITYEEPPPYVDPLYQEPPPPLDPVYVDPIVSGPMY